MRKINIYLKMQYQIPRKNVMWYYSVSLMVDTFKAGKLESRPNRWFILWGG